MEYLKKIAKLLTGDFSGSKVELFIKVNTVFMESGSAHAAD